MKIAVIGTGAYSLALSHIISKKNYQLCLWTESEEKLKEWKKTKQIKSIMPDYTFPKNITLTTSFEECLKNADAVLLACGSKFVATTCEAMKPYYKKDLPICIATKGIDEETHKPLSVIVRKKLDTKNVAVISGPTFAIDVIHENPVALAIAGTNKETTTLFIKILKSKTLKLRNSRNMLGIQICGSVKNIIAIASGVLAGLGYSESTTAFLINESLHDIKHLIRYLGGSGRTILSYAGVGDLLMTCMSNKSRNYSFGYVIGHDKTKDKIEAFLNTHTVEGYSTLKAIINLMNEKNIRIELIYLINDIVEGKKDPNTLADFLINKE